MALQPLTRSDSPPDAGQPWRASDYARNARFVAELGAPLLAWLAPAPGERILDLGCGDGALSAKLREAGAEVHGVDASPAMVAAARARNVPAEVLDGHALRWQGDFDAVFSNAALHWMKRDPDAVLRGVHRALRPGGRFVGELGGRGNVRQVREGIGAVLAQHGIAAEGLEPWYFPSPGEYRQRLQAAGFGVERMETFARPTMLPGDVTDWLQTFGQWFLPRFPADERPAVLDAIRAALAPALLRDGRWVLDYVRLRFASRRAN
ncbi:MAG TPA: methyltransferase domain-containing protein [Nevskiaceae bacterium]